MLRRSGARYVRRMLTHSSPPRRGPLHEVHASTGAKFGEFAGWQMPLQYRAGVLTEHAAVRERVGIFDVSHLGTIWLTGRGAAEFLNSCITNDLERIPAGRAQYTLCCNDRGGLVDDLNVSRLADDELLWVPNAANVRQVARLLAAAAPSDVRVRDDSGAYAIIAVQGPASAQLLRDVRLSVPEVHLGFDNARSPITGGDIMVCRTGYTGERGYELIVGATAAAPLWDAVLRAGERLDGLPCGLAARDTLRTEMGYSLHGHELTPEITPVEAGLSWAVGWDKPAFWGRAALLEQRRVGASRHSVGLTLPPGAIARPGMPVLERSGTDAIGVVTSGTFSPTLRLPIALALLTRRPEQVPRGMVLGVEIRGRVADAHVTKPPFVSTAGLR